MSNSRWSFLCEMHQKRKNKEKDVWNLTSSKGLESRSALMKFWKKYWKCAVSLMRNWSPHILLFYGKKNCVASSSSLEEISMMSTWKPLVDIVTVTTVGQPILARLPAYYFHANVWATTYFRMSARTFRSMLWRGSNIRVNVIEAVLGRFLAELSISTHFALMVATAVQMTMIANTPKARHTIIMLCHWKQRKEWVCAFYRTVWIQHYGFSR